MMKAAPKHAENVAVGSFTPSTVPATCTHMPTPPLRTHPRPPTPNHHPESKPSIRHPGLVPPHTYQRGVPTDEVVHRLRVSQLAHGWQHAKRVARQQDDVLRVRSNAWHPHVRNVLDRVRGPRVLCTNHHPRNVSAIYLPALHRHISISTRRHPAPNVLTHTRDEMAPTTQPPSTASIACHPPLTSHRLVTVVHLPVVLLEHHVLQHCAVQTNRNRVTSPIPTKWNHNGTTTHRTTSTPAPQSLPFPTLRPTHLFRT
jgi:hypothetical protein